MYERNRKDIGTLTILHACYVELQRRLHFFFCNSIFHINSSVEMPLNEYKNVPIDTADVSNLIYVSYLT